MRGNKIKRGERVCVESRHSDSLYDSLVGSEEHLNPRQGALHSNKASFGRNGERERKRREEEEKIKEVVAYVRQRLVLL